MIDTNRLRELLDADRDNLLDVTDWLATMPQENFDRHIHLDLFGKLDPVAHDALRHPANAERWTDSLAAIRARIQGQLADPERRTAEHDGWRKRAVNFLNMVERSQVEAKALKKRRQNAASTAASAAARKTARREAGERALQRLKEAHEAEFTQYLAEEYGADGIPLPDHLYRHLRNHAAADTTGAHT